MGLDKCHSASNWSNLAPCLKKNIVDGEDIFVDSCDGGLRGRREVGRETAKVVCATEGSGNTCNNLEMSWVSQPSFVWQVVSQSDCGSWVTDVEVRRAR